MDPVKPSISLTSSPEISWADPDEETTDKILFYLADLIADEEGVDIEYAYRLAQLRYGTIVFVVDRKGE